MKVEFNTLVDMVNQGLLTNKFEEYPNNENLNIKKHNFPLSQNKTLKKVLVDSALWTLDIPFKLANEGQRSYIKSLVGRKINEINNLKFESYNERQLALIESVEKEIIKLKNSSLKDATSKEETIKFKHFSFVFK
jgi:hypothetical protein